MAGIPQLLVER